jgi:hypothetical protein
MSKTERRRLVKEAQIARKKDKAEFLAPKEIPLPEGVVLRVPTDLGRISALFGNAKHIPSMKDIPDEFNLDDNPYRNAVRAWFFAGCNQVPNGIEVDGVKFRAKYGINITDALVAIRSVLTSFSPSHEHKMAACGYMLSQWFDKLD